MRVLFLDDDDDLREAMVDAVTMLGHECTSTSSVEQMTHLPIGQFQLAILDINLGESTQSGIDAYRWLAQQHFGGSISFLTGHGRDHPLVAEAVALGKAQVLQKPVQAADLAKLLGG
jgi:DNA-binding NtrC family response regulator